MKSLFLPLTVLIGIFSSDIFGQSILAPGAHLEKLSGDFKFAEGATCDAKGNVFFTDQPNNRIMEWSVDGTLSVFLQPAGRANGMFFDAQGNLIACADEKNELWSITPDKKIAVIEKDYEKKYLNGPNDVWIAPGGNMYITDPFYKRPYWDHATMAQDNQAVYFRSVDGKRFIRLTEDLKQPNGITGTPDGKRLFVADIGASRTFRYEIQPDGSLTNRLSFCNLGSDGMTIDSDGNLFLTGHGVTVFNSDGHQIEHIDIPEPWVGNVSFGGKDHKTLFITASRSLYSIALRMPGANPSK